MEIWKDYYNYEVSNMGNVRSKRFMKNLKPRENSCGYERVQISSNKNKKFTHRLVAICFLEKPKGKDFVNHIDGNKKNNRSENLEWVTASENDIHKYKTGLATPNITRAKLSKDNVKEIRCLLKNKINCVEISKKYGVNRKTISDIKNGKTWNLHTNGK
jgi:hypothetical protein